MATDRATRNAELMKLAGETLFDGTMLLTREEIEATTKLRGWRYLDAAAHAVPDLVRENEEMAKALSDARSFIRNAHSQDVRSQASLLADIERLVPLEDEP